MFNEALVVVMCGKGNFVHYGGGGDGRGGSVCGGVG